MPLLRWDRRILVGLTCCAVTVTLWTLCIWQLVTRLKTETTGSVSPPCSCLNDGVCRDGACVCPEEWVGPLCELVNFCEASVYTESTAEGILQNLTFQRIIVGRYSYSAEKCEPDTVNGNRSKAIRMCTRVGKIPTLNPPHILNCHENLDSLASQVETADFSNISAIASNTQILTSMPNQLTTQSISTAAHIAVNILRKPNISTDSQASASVMATVSQLLDANETEFNQNNLIDVTASLTRTMEEFSLTSNITQSNIAVQSVPLKLNSSSILFSAQKDTELGYLLSTKLEVQENVPGLSGDLSTEVQILLNILNNNCEGGVLCLLQQGSPVTHPVTTHLWLSPVAGVTKPAEMPVYEGASDNGRAGFVLYQNSKFFKSRIYKSHGSFSKRIVSGNVDGGRTSGVELAFSPKYNTSALQLRDHACVFWDYATNDWSTVGCTKGRDQFLRCKCNHTTNFAVLMSFQIKYKYAKPLEYISYIGIGLSMAGLVITMLFQIFTRKTRKSSITWMLVSLCFSMLIFNILFISGIENRNARNYGSDTARYDQQNQAYNTSDNTLLTSDLVDPPADPWCTAVAVLLHYFLLATFMWTALNAAQLYLLLLRAMQPLPGRFLVTVSVVGWGIPAMVVAITFGVTYREGKALNYRQEEFCWLAGLDENHNFSMEKPMLWSFLLPVALILLFNFIVLINITVSVIWRDNKNLTRNKKDSFMKRVLSTISIVVVLGITWTVGYLMLINQEETSLIFSYVFCILNGTQGLQICILYAFRSPIFKKKVSEVFPVFSMPEIPVYLHSKIYYVSKAHLAKHAKETFRSSTTVSEDISLSTLSNCS